MNLHTKSYFLSTRGWDQFKKRTYPCRASPCRSCTSEPSLTSRGLFLIPTNSPCPSFALAATCPLSCLSQLPLSMSCLELDILEIFNGLKEDIINQGWIEVVSKYSLEIFSTRVGLWLSQNILNQGLIVVVSPSRLGATAACLVISLGEQAGGRLGWGAAQQQYCSNFQWNRNQKTKTTKLCVV